MTGAGIALVAATMAVLLLDDPEGSFDLGEAETVAPEVAIPEQGTVPERRTRWSVPLPTTSPRAVTASEGRLLVAGDDEVRAHELGSGARLWTSPLHARESLPLDLLPVTSDTVPLRYGPNLSFLSLETGRTTTRESVPVEVADVRAARPWLLVIEEGRFGVPDRVVAVSVSGDEVWERSVPAGTLPLITDGRGYLVELARRQDRQRPIELVALERNTGEDAWRARLHVRPIATATVGRAVAVGTGGDEPEVTLLDDDGTVRWRAELPGFPSRLVHDPASGGLVAMVPQPQGSGGASDGPQLAWFSLEDGTQRARRVLPDDTASSSLRVTDGSTIVHSGQLVQVFDGGGLVRLEVQQDAPVRDAALVDDATLAVLTSEELSLHSLAGGPAHTRIPVGEETTLLSTRPLVLASDGEAIGIDIQPRGTRS